MQASHEEYYKQILFANVYTFPDKDLFLKIHFSSQLCLSIFLLFILTSQSNALPIPQVIRNQTGNVSTVRVPSSQVNTYRVYQHLPNIDGQVSDPLRRERYRRTMIDRMLSRFDEDADGQLSKDEFYSLSLRLNIFPKFHLLLKQTKKNTE